MQRWWRFDVDVIIRYLPPHGGPERPTSWMNRMPKTLFPLALAATLLSGCASQQSDTTLDKTRLVGIWAMLPLSNGIANVAEYQADGKVRLHPFNCVESQDREVEVSEYALAADGRSIHIDSPKDSFDLKVLAYSGTVMILGMKVADTELKFVYKKVDKVESLCRMFPNAKEEAARRTRYQASDFVAAPVIPAHAGMERYQGDWKGDKGFTQVQVRRAADGQWTLSQDSSENWTYLFNDVHWEGEVLHYQSFAYSEKPSLYSHPYHKTNTPMTLEPASGGRLLNTYVVGGKRFEQLLHRAAD